MVKFLNNMKNEVPVLKKNRLFVHSLFHSFQVHCYSAFQILKGGTHRIKSNGDVIKGLSSRDFEMRVESSFSLKPPNFFWLVKHDVELIYVERGVKCHLRLK